MWRLLEHRYFPWVAAFVAVLLCSRSLWLGWYADDYVHRAMLRPPSESTHLSRAAWDIFAFYRGDSESRLELLEDGLLPWWSEPGLSLAFFRPLSSLTHWIDYRLWPNSAPLMHLHSLLWFWAAIVATGVLFRRLAGPAASGVATLLFALDDAHIMPAMWLANRNATVSLFFGVLTLVFHDRWRSDRSKAGALLAPLAFLLSLLGSEMGIAVAGYLFAYGFWFESGSRLERLRSVLPVALVASFWWVSYTLIGYGASGSGLYIDPARDPWVFLRAVVNRMPVLIWGQFGLSADLALFFSQDAVRLLWVLSIVLILFLLVLFLPVVRADRAAGFWLTGFILSLVPACATFVSDRLLLFAGVGGMGFLGIFLVLSLEGFSGRFRAGRKTRRTVVGVLITVHLVLAPLGLLIAPSNLAFFRDVITESARTYPSDPAVAEQKVLIVSTPTAFVSLFAPLIQRLDGLPGPVSSTVLGSSIQGIEVRRPDDATLVLRPRGGFLLPPGSGAAVVAPAFFDRRYPYSLLDWLFVRDPRLLRQSVPLGDGLVVEILEAGADGRPLEAAFRFDRSLESESFRWIRWHRGAYIPFEPPSVGEGVLIPPVELNPGPW